MTLKSILGIYRARLRVRAVVVQELLAVLGLAVGVALLFASQVASTSLNRSVSQISSQLVGNMQLELQSRSPEGFNDSLLATVRRIPGVREALPVLEEQADLIGPRGRESVELLGTSPRFARAGGPLLRHFSTEKLAHQQALALPAPVAQAIGAQALTPIEIQVGTRVTSTLLGATLQEGDVGPLVDSPVAIAPVAYAEQLAGTAGHVTRIFVRADPGQISQVRGALLRLAAGRLNVEPADFETTLFAKAAGPTNQAAGLFSAISALVGFLFAFNAMLITAHLRRALVVELRRHGATRRMTIRTLMFDVLVLGVLGCLLGLLMGDIASIALFHSNPGYLSYAFPVGSRRVVTWQSAGLAILAGMLAACIGVLGPMRGELSRPLRQSRDEQHPNNRVRPWGLARLGAGLAGLAATTAIIVLDPSIAILGVITLTIALLALLPALLDLAVFAVDRLSGPARSAATRLAVTELRAPAARTRTLAIAATGAIAVFGSVAIQGAHGNLQTGLDHDARDMNHLTDVWVSVAGTANTLATTPFTPTSTSKLAAVAGVRSVAIYRGGFLNIGDRVTWIIAPPRSAPILVPASQILQGNVALANQRLRAGGWIVISQAIASEHHLHLGEAFRLPTPVPMTFRIAAFSTNVGWPTGAVFMNAQEYSRAWSSPAATAYNITLAPGVSPPRAAQAIRRVLGSHSGLVVQTAREREQKWRASSRQGLSRLSQIALLVLIAAALAMAGATAAMIWERRTQLADFRRQGYMRSVLWQALMYQSLLLVASSCIIGAIFGLYGQVLGTHFLKSVTGFPVVFSVGVLVALTSIALVSLAAAAIVALPGYFAARVTATANPG
jgi:putative ABC transport system permease protein